MSKQVFLKFECLKTWVLLHRSFILAFISIGIIGLNSFIDLYLKVLII